MTEEIKNAIKFLQNLEFDEYEWWYCGEEYETREETEKAFEKAQKIIINLIEKQQKEIKELKLITNTYNSYEGNDMDHTKIIIADSNYFINGTFVNKFISKDKIRKIIAELDNQNYNNYELSVALSKSLETLIKE